MSLLRPFKCTDLFKFNNVNLDNWTETYSISFYLSYLAQWPDLSLVQVAPHSLNLQQIDSSSEQKLTPDSLRRIGENQAGVQEGRTMGYVIGKAEGKGKLERHGHVTAITVAPEYRRLGLAQGMMDLLECVSDGGYNGYFVDLFVRPSNRNAVTMYENMGYSVYRKVKEYYQGGGENGRDEDGYDMRKALPRDKKKETVREGGRGKNFVVNPSSIWFEPVYRNG